MFEEQLASLLASYLGQVLDIQQDQLHVNIWTAWKTGLTLEDVPLRQGVSLGPLSGVTLVGGKIGTVQISVPWGSLMRLKSAPMLVSLKDVEIVLGFEEDVAGVAAKERYMVEKRNILAAQQLKHVAEASLDTTRMMYSFIKHALSMVLGRLKVEVENVSVRVVDIASQENVVRFHMDGMETVDQALMFHLSDKNMYRIAERGESIVDVADGVLRHGASKNVRFSGVQISLYDSDTHLLDTDFNVKLFYDITSSESQVLLTMECEKCCSSVDMDHVGRLMHVVERAEWSTVRRYVAHLRPDTKASSTFDAKQMWRFAVNSVLLEIYGPLKFSMWKPEKERLHDRRRYVLLYRKKIERERDQRSLGEEVGSQTQEQGLLSATGEAQLSLLEETMSVSDILACRSAAKTSLMRSRNYEILDVKNKDGVATESCWVKIPTLADMEELFQTFDFTPDNTEEAPPRSFDIQFLSMMRIPRIECRVHSALHALDASMVCVNVAGGHVSNLDGNTHVMGSMQEFSLSTSRGSFIEPNVLSMPCAEFHYNGGKPALHVQIPTGLSSRVVLADIQSLILSLPVPSADAYGLHWMHSAIKMEKYAYCMETMERLEQVGNFLNLDMILGPVEIALGDFEIALESLGIRSTTESDNFQELHRIYSLMKSFSSRVGNAQGSVELPRTLPECIHILEDQLIYKNMDVSMSNFRVTHTGHAILHHVNGTVGVKMNRLFGDFSHPQMLLDFASGPILLDMYDAALASFMDVQSTFMSFQEAFTDNPSVDETTRVCMSWPQLQLHWLDGDFESQSSIVSGDGRITMEATSLKTNTEIFVSVNRIEILHGNGMKNIDIPMAGFSIPYVARMISVDSIILDAVQMPCSQKVHMKCLGISLIGDKNDSSNFIRCQVPNKVSSIEASYVESQAGSSIDIAVSNMDIGHGTVLRSSLVSQALSNTDDIQEVDGTKSMTVKFAGQNLRCSFVHDIMYNAIAGLPVQYQEFSKVHSTITTIDLGKGCSAFQIGEKMSLTSFELEKLSIYCGFLGEHGASMSAIFQVPNVIGDLNDSSISLDCPIIRFGIHPHQLLLLKGVSDLIKYETTCLAEFYRICPERTSTPSKGTIDLSSIQFNPISLKIGVFRLGIFGALPAAGAMCLQCCSMMINVQPGLMEASWNSLGLLVYPDQGNEEVEIESGSISDGSSVYNATDIVNGHQVISPGLSTKASSVFLDTISIASRCLSESSFVSQYYSAGGDSVSEAPGYDDIYLGSNIELEFFETEKGFRAFDVSFGVIQEGNNVVKFGLSEKHANMTIPSLRISVHTQNLAKASQFYHTYSYFISDHFENQRTPREFQPNNKSISLREFALDLKSLTLLVEAEEQTQYCDNTHECASSVNSDDLFATNSGDVVKHSIELKFRSFLRLTHGNVGHKCAAKIMGLSIQSYSGGQVTDRSLHALLGNREIVFTSSWKEKSGELSIFKNDVSFGQVSVWLHNRNIAPTMKVVSQLNTCIERFQTKRIMDNEVIGDILPAHAPTYAHATIMISIERLSLSCSQMSLSGQLVHLCEIAVNDMSFVSHFTDDIVHGSASLSVEGATSSVTDGMWMSFLDETKVKCQFALPDFSNGKFIDSDIIRVDLGIQEVNLTIDSNVINSLYITQLMIEEVVVHDTHSVDTALYVTHNEIQNDTECTLDIVIKGNDGKFGERCVLEPGARIFPKQKQSYLYKSGYPDSAKGISDLSIANEDDSAIDVAIYFKIHGSEEELIGPLHMRSEHSKRHNVGLDSHSCVLSTITKRSRIGTWKTYIRPVVKFWNNTDLDIELRYMKDANLVKETFVSTRTEQVWLPISASTGYYQFKLISEEGYHLNSSFTMKCESEWSESIYVDMETFNINCTHSVIVCMAGETTVSIALSIERCESWVLMTASPIFGIENFMPMPVRVSNGVGTVWNVDSTNSMLIHLSHFPLILSVEPAGFSATKPVLLNVAHENPYIKWVDDDVHDFVDLLEFNLWEKTRGKNEMYAQLHVTRSSSTGTIMLRILSPFWIYNYSRVPMSLDCFINPERMKEMQVLLDNQEEVLDDIVPEVWISPLELAENPPSMSARSFQSSTYISEQSFEGMDADADGSSRKHANVHMNLADGPCDTSHGSFVGLGSLAQDQVSLNVDSDSEGSWNVIGHSFSGLISPNYKGRTQIGSSLPCGPNSHGFRVLNHPTKKFRLRFSRQKCRPGSTYWSSNVVLDEQRCFEAIDVPLSPSHAGIHAHQSQGSYPIIVELQKSPSTGENSERIVVKPKFVIVNQLNAVIQYKQQGAPVDFRIYPGNFSPVQWTDVGLPKKICIRIHHAGWMWSGGFSLDHVGDLFLKLRHRDRGITKIVRADISRTSDHGTEQIVLRSNPEEFAPYRLENCSLETLTVRQKGVIDQQDVLKPYCSLDYTWDEPSLPHIVTVECPGGLFIGTFDLDKVGSLSSVTIKGKMRGKPTKLGVLIHAEGPLKVLTIFNYDYHNTPMIHEKSYSKSASNEFEFKCNVRALSVSCIHSKKERLFFILEQLSLFCFASSSRIDVSGNLKAIQIDNTSMSCVYPVVFALPAPESKLTSRVRRGVEAKGGSSSPVTWEFRLWRKGPENDILCFDLADLNIRSFAIYIEQGLLNLLGELLDARAQILNNPPERPQSLSPSPSFLHVSSLQKQPTRGPVAKYYFDRIGISPVEITISFNSSTEKQWNRILLQQVLALADIEDARLWLSGILLKNALFDQQSMFSYLSTHYKRSILLEVFKVVGAANVLGDPMSFLQHISFGFWEFLSFPAMGLMDSMRNLTPSGFILGLVQGTKGLLQNVLFAISNATTKASSAAHKAILLWGYGTINHSRQQLPMPYANSMSNMDKAEESLVAATLRGIIGLVTDPIKGAEEGGLSGFLDGVRHGTFGAILIPTSAWLQMCASTALSIRKAVAGSANIGWSRPPRWINPEDGILPYNRNDAMGRWLFFQMKHTWEDLIHMDTYVHCSRISSHRKGVEEYVILTDKNVVVVQARGLNWIPRILWRSKICMIEAVKLDQKLVTIVSNPELIKKSMMKIQENTRTLYSVFTPAFDSENDANTFYTQIKKERKQNDPFIAHNIKFHM